MQGTREPARVVLSLLIGVGSIVQSPAVPGQNADRGGYRPHYQGFGVATPGGRGGSIRRVTNLHDSGPGSLRAALTEKEPRFVIFEVSGTIALQSPIYIRDPFITIAGQTAPSPGITVRNHTLRIQTHDVVVQHLRARLGDAAPQIADSIWVRDNAYNVVIDHCSLSWATDEVLSFNAAAGREPSAVAVLDSIISEGLGNPRTGSRQSKGLLFAPSAGSTATVARNLLAHNGLRAPSMHPGWRAIWINNVVYNAGSYLGFSFYVGGTARRPYPGTEALTFDVVHVGNVGLPGPNTPMNTKTITIETVNPGSRFYLADNIGHGLTTADQWAGVNLIGDVNAEEIRLDAPPSWFTETAFEIKPAVEVAEHVLANAGARPLDRDEVDERIVRDVREGTGRIIATQREVGEWPQLTERRRPLEVPEHAHEVIDDVGRTVIEHWLEAFARELEPPH